MRTLPFDGETDDAFRRRTGRAAAIAKVLVDACLANRCMHEYIADPKLPYTVESVRQSPTVRVEYEQAVAIGGIGETLAATKAKRWGDGPQVLPLYPEDEFYADRITYMYRENSVYNRRFEQRKRMKELLGKKHRKLVGAAQSRYGTKAIFLRNLTDEQVAAIRRILGVEPDVFWRACKGRTFLELPPRMVQLQLEFDDGTS